MTTEEPAYPVGDALFRLDGRVALVTGAGGVLAGATARGFARAGASLVLTDRDPVRLKETGDAVRALGAEAIEVACRGH